MRKWFDNFLTRTQPFRSWGVRHIRLFYILSVVGFGFELMIRLMFEMEPLWSVFIGLVLLLSLHQTITLHHSNKQKWYKKGLLWMYITWLVYCIVRTVLVFKFPISLIGQPYMGFITGLILMTFIIMFVYYAIHTIGTLMILLVQYTIVTENQKDKSEESYQNNLLS